ncbi:hypothetical protein GCM10011380_17910 [Sphingomonas metalli]|uniref:Ice-binding protein C-terminal domain-containing protein n=1 Tax=Sphingomonas metalli TaxID=1779358 RepID=A0A916T2C1_9SPHN|nr:choice-of-anchor K domain-containing protein [Sphingomonas metalli]GGB28686.1 hypothetical protein GCM10011380_17910 [Sphingomonas metalli]
MRNLALAAALGAAVFASPALAANTVSGTTSATFTNPQPSTGVTTGIGTANVTWGTAATDVNKDFKANSLSFKSNSPFAAALGQQFTIGSLTYYNGTILNGTELTGLTFNLSINFTDPALGLLTKSFALGLKSTPNTGTDDENADYIYLPSLQSTANFTANGQSYAFELRGFANVKGDGYLNSTSREFHVRENGTATADVYGVLTAVPEPATWAMMLVGFGMVGAATRYRRRSTKAAIA